MDRTKSGVVLVKMFSDPPRPYQLFQADIHTCPKCGYEVVAGVANQPYAEHFQDDFNDKFRAAYNHPNIAIVYEFER
jgi:hypothetical protein